MKVGTRIIVLIGLLGALSAATLLLCASPLNRARAQYAEVLDRDATMRRRVLRLTALVHERVEARYAVALTGLPSSVEAATRADRQWDIALSELRQAESGQGHAMGRIAEITRAMNAFERDEGTSMADLTRPATVAPGVPDPALRDAVVHLRAGEQRVLDDLDDLDRALRMDMLTHARAADERLERARAQLVACAVATIVFALFCGLALLTGLRAPLVELTAMAQRITEGRHERIGWTRRDELGDLGRAIEAMSDALGERERRLQKHSALIALDARLGAALNRAHDVRAVSEGALSLVAEAMGVFGAALFVWDDAMGKFRAEATHGTVRDDVVSRGFARGEGFLGRIAERGETIKLAPAPDDAPKLETSTTIESARTDVVLPVRRGDETIALIELLCVATPDEETFRHTEALVDQLGVALANAMAGRERDALLVRLEAQYREVQAREERLLAQSEKLDAQARELGRTNDELQQMNQSKSQFIATMSHELRTPLNSILGFTQLLLEKSKTLSQEDRGTLHEVLAAGRHLLSLINDILDLARIGAGKLSLRRSSVSVGLIAQEVVEILRPQAQSKGVALSSEVPVDLAVDADPSRLRQILLNLMGNAVKFTERGSVTVRTRVLPDDAARVEVVDTGPGISAEDRAKLFREFSQLDSSGRRHEGSGLGLVIARELVLAHGGSIDVDSEPGRGSTFWFTLPVGRLSQVPTPLTLAAPVTPPPPVPAVAPVPAPVPEPVAATTAPIRLLLVEDHPRNVRLMSAMLGDANVRIEHAADGPSGVSAAVENPPDLVLLDLELPGFDGFEVARQLRGHASTASVPIIAVTARALPADEARARAIGCSDFVTKPVDATRLRASIEALVGRKLGGG